MGMVAPVCELLFFENAFRKIEGDVLFIGRQDIFLTPPALQALINKYGVRVPSTSFVETNPARPHLISDKSLMSHFDINSLTFMDVSDYEGAEIVWDLGYPVSEELHGKFDFIFNGSCLDNMFNPGTAMFSLSKMLKPDGRILHLEHGTSFNGPYVMYPPCWFFDYYVQNGFNDCKTYLGEFHNSETLFYGPWNLFLHDWRYNSNGGVPTSQHAMIVTLAEKRAGATTERQPIQEQYRRDAKVRETYARNVEHIEGSKRPIFGMVPRSNPSNAQLLKLPPIMEIYQGVYPKI